ncbi:hypothetical protein [Paraburkholderia sp. GAS334]|uniref:hypothetical protein n=1 Tax=Paraburkholderia sp. GAS334 TaxID=3035131 RepID=UPI003D1EA02F
MNRKTWLALAVAVWSAAGTGAPIADETASGPVNIRLTATKQNAGKVGQVTLAAQGSATELVFIIGGVPSSTTLPAHLYTYIYPGSCGHLGEKFAYAMNDRTVLGDRVPNRTLTMAKIAPISLQDLTSGDYAIVVRSSPADGNRDIFCGNVKSGA